MGAGASVRRLSTLAVVALVAVLLQAVQPASAQTVPHDRLVAAVPTTATPHVLDGEVWAVAEVGSRIVLGGSFTQARNASGNTAVVTRNRILAFDKQTGQIDPSFAPSFNATVRTLVAAPDGQSVYVGGQFGSLNGAGVPKIVRLSMSNGARVPGFNPPAPNAVVYDAKLSGNRLFIAGVFDRVGNTARSRLAELDPATGALRATTSFAFEGVHRVPPNGVSQNLVYKIDVSPDGRMLVAIGNFRTVDGQDRVQIAAFDTSGGQTSLLDWQTDGYKANCYDVFDYYIKDVDFAPDSSYFVTTSVGGYGSGPPSLCDTAVRWDSSDRGSGVQPEWVNYTGGDSLYAVAVTGSVIYVGGHNRWLNNPFAADRAGPGAVEREGIAALDPANGMPLDWNPGRARGRGVFDLLSTSTGLYAGSDTDRIANFLYRGRIAFFPLQGGSVVPQPTPPSLPVDVTLVGSQAAASSPGYLYRINAGGPALASLDDGPDWSADSSGTSPLRNSGSNAASYGPVPTLTAGVPAGTPRAVYSSERWDPSGGEEMAWSLPVQAGRQVELRLYLANRCTCTASTGQRVFDITVDGATVVDDLDLSAQPGHDVATVVRVPVTSDGAIDVRFLHGVENPLVNGIEVVDPALLGGPVPDVAAVELGFDGATAGAPAPVTGGAWNGVRGTVWVDGRLYSAHVDGTFSRRSHDGTSFGPVTTLDLYGLAAWSEDIQAMTSLFYEDGRLYFTRLDSGRLYWRYFSTQSGIVGAQRFEAQPGGAAWAQVRGAFLASGHLYWVDATTGDLKRTAWSDGSTSGPATTVSGPGRDGVDWRARALFAVPGTAPNRAPTAAGSGQCDGTRCTLDAADSTDPDGEVVAWRWTLPGGRVLDGRRVTADLGPGTVQVGLTVTDDRGASASTSVQVSTDNAVPVARASVSCEGLLCTLDAAASSDADGQVVAWRWDTGDGTTLDGEQVSHRYGSAGARTATLTVTDERGATGTTTVEVDTDNAAPVADFSFACEALECRFDASASRDPDGTVTSYAWTFGDGATATGAVVEHSYAGPGGVEVTLTVSDDAGASGQLSREVQVSDSAVEHVGSAVDTDAGSTQVHELQIPTDVAAGDVLVAAFSTNSGTATVTDPAGWQRRGTASTNGMQGVVWTRVATAADAGAAVRTTTSVFARGSLVISAYRGGTVPAGTVAVARETTSTATHRTPQLQAPAGSLVVQYWSDKTASTSTWTAPADHEVRQTGAGTGSGHMSWLLADTRLTAAGAAGGVDAVADSATGNAVMATVVVQPAP
ncbi:PKD domain-containing protein [Aquipuribacter sp. SD81]|uniref:PKD domain-containing protein n=1 Tax=Aquipuribacter sp. SD81 TaxID=3127703 RepID=UPI003016969C